MKEYELHPEAYADLDEIAEYIGENGADAAKRVVAKIFDSIRDLVPFPHRGHRRTDLYVTPVALPTSVRLPNSLCAR
jgi:plasmid stabilization system protein ParE